LVKRIADRSGLAVLFDAMMFLTVMSIVSVSLLSVLTVDIGEKNRDQDFVEGVHSVLLRSTLELGTGPPQTLADAIENFLRWNDSGLGSSIGHHVSIVLDSYFGPGFHYLWCIERGDVTLEVSSEGYQVKGKAEVHVSQVLWDGDDGSMRACLEVILR
jgi:hypothetical protein